MWFAVTAICVVLSMLYYYIFEMKIARQKRLTSNIPHPTPLPILGNSLEFGYKSDEILSNFHRIVKTYGKVVRLWIGTELYVVLSDVNHIQTILTSNKLLKKAHVYDLLDPWLGAGLLTSDGDEWRRQRKIITPTFHFKILEQFVDTFSSSSNILTDKLKKEIGNNGFDVSKLVVLCTLDIICETSMGTEVNAQLQKENAFVSAIHDVAISVLQRALRPWLFPDTLFKISPTGQLFYKQLAVINNFIQEVIQNRRQKKEEQKAQNQNDEDALVFGQKKKTAFLDMLIDYNMSDEEIRDQVNTFMFAGHDTTTSAISFTLYCLMKYPDVQEKVYNEIKEVIGASEEPVTIQNLKDLKYLECVISETQRLYPSVPYIGRRITEDVQLTPEYILPKGCSVNLFFYQLHRDPELFEDPEVYNPDRFLPDEIQKRHPFAYCPFSAGSRNCVGQKFAMLEVKSVLSSIVRKFKLLPPINCPDIIVGSELVLRSVTGVYIRLENR